MGGDGTTRFGTARGARPAHPAAQVCPSKNLVSAAVEIRIAFRIRTWARRFAAHSLYTVAVQTWSRSAASDTVRSWSEP